MMGVLYHVEAVDPEELDRLEAAGIELPYDFGRYPTLRELGDALAVLDDCEVEVDEREEGGFDAWITDKKSGAITRLTVLAEHYDGIDQPCKFYFAKGSERLILRVMYEVAQRCGSFTITPDTGGEVLVVEDHSNIQKLLSA